MHTSAYDRRWRLHEPLRAESEFGISAPARTIVIKKHTFCCFSCLVVFYYQTNSSVVRHSGFGFDSKDLLPKMSDVARDRVTVCQKPTHSFVLYGK